MTSHQATVSALDVFKTEDGLILNVYNNSILRVRFVREIDAEFILHLRADPKLSEFLSPVSGDIDDQHNWIKDYLARESLGDEYYFLFLYNEEKVGTIRLYNIDDSSCTYGSWLFSRSVLPKIPLMAESLAYEVCFNVLNKVKIKFDVRLNNKKVVNYHKLKKLHFIGSDEMNAFYSLSPKEWDESKARISGLLGVRIDLSVHDNRLLISGSW